MSSTIAEGLFIGLIPDGGRRAVNNDPTRYGESYRKGAEKVGDMLKLCVRDARVRVFAAWGLSDDNASKRTLFEREVLSDIFVQYLEQLDADLRTPEYAGVKVVHMGNPDLLATVVQQKLIGLSQLTAHRVQKVFGICLGYGAHDEMNRAVERRDGDKPQHQRNWKQYLDLPFRGRMPYKQADLIVRTGTDPLKPYTSGYLLPYQGPGTTERFSATLLPEYDPENLRVLIDEKEAEQMRKGA